MSFKFGFCLLFLPNKPLVDPCHVVLCTEDVHVLTVMGVCQECPGNVVGESREVGLVSSVAISRRKLENGESGHK